MSGYIIGNDQLPSGRYGSYIEDNGIMNAGGINYASLFPGAYQVIQSDLGLTYGGTLLASGTTPPVITLTGTLSTTPVPITVSCTVIGALGAWSGTYSFDNGATSTPFTSAATVPLTGKGTGLTLNIAAGSALSNNVWKATCAGLADQSGNAKHNAQATASAQPVITVGLNGKPGLLFDGVNDYMANSVGSLLSFPHQVLIVGRRVSSLPASNVMVSGDLFADTIYEGSAGFVTQYNGTTGNAIAFAAFTNQRFAAVYTNSTSDSLRVGSLSTTGINSGAAIGTNRYVGASYVPGQFGNVEIFAIIYAPVGSYAAFDAAINSAAGYGVGAIGV